MKNLSPSGKQNTSSLCTELSSLKSRKAYPVGGCKKEATRYNAIMVAYENIQLYSLLHGAHFESQHEDSISNSSNVDVHACCLVYGRKQRWALFQG